MALENNEHKCRISHESCNACEADFNPDIILFDFNSIGMDMASAYPHAKFIILDTGYLTDKDIITILTSYKIEGIISTHIGINIFKKAIRAVYEGQMWLDHYDIKNLLRKSDSIHNENVFTNREKDIIKLVCHGCTNKEIAQRLYISDQTVKAHMSRIFKKYNVSNRSQLVSHILRGHDFDSHNPE
jgi:DNA-binding NarL/FixJ family response regulator